MFGLFRALEEWRFTKEVIRMIWRSMGLDRGKLALHHPDLPCRHNDHSKTTIGQSSSNLIRNLSTGELLNGGRTDF